MVSEELLKQKATENYAKKTGKNIVEVKHKAFGAATPESREPQSEVLLETLRLANRVIEEQQNVIRHYEQLIGLIMTACDSE